MATTASQFKIGSSDEKLALEDLFKRIKNKKVTTCQDLKEELNKFSNLDREEWPGCWTSPWTSPLAACVEADNVQLIQTCLDNGIIINSTDDNDTALYLSIYLNNSESMKLLLDQDAEVTILDLATAFTKSETLFQELCATLEAKHGLNSHGLDPLARIEQLLMWPSAVSPTLSQKFFERTLIWSLSVGEAALHVGFESCVWPGQIDSVHKAVQWVLSKGPIDSNTLYYLCAIAIKENCKDSQDLLLKGGLDCINGKKAFTVEDFYLLNLKLVCLGANKLHLFIYHLTVQPKILQSRFISVLKIGEKA
jgi:hypothetical protein